MLTIGVTKKNLKSEKIIATIIDNEIAKVVPKAENAA